MAQVKKCLFPAAGFGTRFLPITKSLPKEMLPLVNKPLIQYGVEEAFDAGMQQICIVTGRYKEALANYFDVSYEVEQKVKGKVVEENLRSIRLLLEQCSFSYTRQKHIRGLGDAVLAGRTLIGRQAFGLVLADMFFPRQAEINNPLQDLVDLHNRYGCSVIGVVEVAAEERDKYGIAEATADKHGVLRAQRLFEKPQKNQTNSNLAICGRYVLTPDVFEILENTTADDSGEVQLTNALVELAAAGELILSKYNGNYFDCGCIEGMVAATNYAFNNQLNC